MTATGVAKAEYAELSVQFRYLVHEEGWIRIPLRLDQAVLRGEVEVPGAGTAVRPLRARRRRIRLLDPRRGGKVHSLTMDVLVPLVTVGEETRLRLSAPRASTSELRLTVPLGKPLARVSEGATLLPAKPAGDGQTVLAVAGLAGDSELAWRKPTSPAAASPRPSWRPWGTSWPKSAVRGSTPR